MTGLRSRIERGVAQTLICLLAFVHVLIIFPNEPALAAPSSNIVIQEVKPGSGNQEFINFFNKASTPVDISGWKLVKYTASGENATTIKTFSSSPPTAINSQDYFLLAHSSYSNNNVDPDETYNASLADNNFIVLVDTTGKSIDSLRWGTVIVPTAFVAEGSAPANPDGNQSLSRNSTHDDTDDNAVDFAINQTASPVGSKPNKPVLNPAEIGDQKITVRWGEVRNAREYEVSYKKASESSYGEALETNSTSKTITGLENGTNYSIQVVATNRNGKSQPAIQTAEPAEVIEASIVYIRENQPATHFGVGIVTAQVDIAGGDEITAEDKPTIAFLRPNSNPIRGPLVYDKEKDKWIASLFVTKGTSSAQDGKVAVELATEKPGKKFAITTGPSFTIDTVVSQPAATMQSRCSTAADSFAATIADKDVERIYVYQVPPTAQSNPIAVAPVVNGKTDEVFIGDNKVEKLYLVAQDKTGNLSDPVEIINDIRASEPQLQLEAKDGRILATWPQLPDATAYILRYRPVGQTQWQEKTITDTSYTIEAPNGKEYEIAAASRDTACNQSAFMLRKATARPQAALAASGRGGVADNESRILNAAYGSEEKDSAGKDEEQKEPTGRKSPLPESEDKNDNGILDRAEGPGGNGIKDGEEDKNGNGIKDGEEDKDGNGIKDGEEDKNGNGIPDGQEDHDGELGSPVAPSPSPSPEEEEGTGFFQDRSRVIIALAILLIVAGTALAAYSWYRGDETTPPDDTPEPDDTNDDTDSTDEEENEVSEDTTAQAETERQGKGKRGGKSRRKTRW